MQVENEFIGSPCGNLDQIMIYFSKAGMGTHYDPATRSISYVPLGMGAPEFSFAALDTGTERPGLEKWPARPPVAHRLADPPTCFARRSATSWPPCSRLSLD